MIKAIDKIKWNNKMCSTQKKARKKGKKKKKEMEDQQKVNSKIVAINPCQ